jgi:hypothetical protein
MARKFRVVDVDQERDRFQAEAIRFAQNEQLPDPETVGGLADMIRQVDVLQAMQAEHPAFRMQLFRREQALGNSPGFRQYREWSERAGFKRPADGVEDFRARLAAASNKTHAEVNAMPVSEAIARLKGEAVNLSDARDKFIYELAVKGVAYDKIASDVNKTHGWLRLATGDAARKALDRYCKRHGLPMPSRKQKRNRQN